LFSNGIAVCISILFYTCAPVCSTYSIIFPFPRNTNGSHPPSHELCFNSVVCKLYVLGEYAHTQRSLSRVFYRFRYIIFYTNIYFFFFLAVNILTNVVFFASKRFYVYDLKLKYIFIVVPIRFEYD
jgi:hypothetical protein